MSQVGCARGTSGESDKCRRWQVNNILQTRIGQQDNREACCNMFPRTERILFT